MREGVSQFSFFSHHSSLITFNYSFNIRPIETVILNFALTCSLYLVLVNLQNPNVDDCICKS